MASRRISHLEQRATLHRAELALLGSVADAVTATRTLAETLQGVLARCMSAAGATRGVLVLHQAGGALEVAAALASPPVRRCRRRSSGRARGWRGF